MRKRIAILFRPKGTLKWQGYTFGPPGPKSAQKVVSVLNERWRGRFEFRFVDIDMWCEGTKEWLRDIQAKRSKQLDESAVLDNPV